jgi:hypothetical protein
MVMQENTGKKFVVDVICDRPVGRICLFPSFERQISRILLE